jgi:hypothetical protein
MAKRKKETCLNCPAKPFSRGLCNACLTAARRLIESGQKTDGELVACGAILESKRPRKVGGLGHKYLNRVERMLLKCEPKE